MGQCMSNENFVASIKEHNEQNVANGGASEESVGLKKRSTNQNHIIEKAKQTIDAANSKIKGLNVRYNTEKEKNEALLAEMSVLKGSSNGQDVANSKYKQQLDVQRKTMIKWKSKIQELSEEIVAIEQERKETDDVYKNNLISINDSFYKIQGDNPGKLKYGKMSKKFVIFTEKINHLFYYDENGPKFFVVKDVSTNNHQIQSNMKRPWFLLIGKKRSVLFAAPSISIRDKWVDFIRGSIENTSEESNTSLIRWNANSVNQPLSPLFDVYESDENDFSVATNSSTKLGNYGQHQRIPSHSGGHMRTRTLSNKRMILPKKVMHNRTQSMTQRSRSTTFDAKPVHVTVTYNIKEDKIEQFLTALKPMIIATNKERGCVRFNIHQDKGEKSKFIMMEEWKSQRYLTMHLKSEHLKKYRDRTRNHNVHKSIPEVFFCSELVLV